MRKHDSQRRLDYEVAEIRENPLSLKFLEACQTLAVPDELKFSMNNGKTLTRLLMLGGAYCHQCHNNHDPEMPITRSVTEINSTAENLIDPETGMIRKSTGDYSTRFGSTARQSAATKRRQCMMH